MSSAIRARALDHHRASVRDLLLVLPAIAGMSCAPDQEPAISHLRRLGQSICDARTFEAIGYWHVARGPQRGRIPIKCLFGPDGEYRFVSGNIDVIHDTYHIGVAIPDEDYVGVYDLREYRERMEPHNRYPGDLLMAAGMGTRGKCDLILPRMRAFGSGWLDDWCADPKVNRITHEEVSGHSCVRYDVRGRDTTFSIWVDEAEPIMWKHTIYHGFQRLSVCYESVTINRDVAPGAFTIPDWMFEADDDEPHASSQES